jgi:hypothetical protein
MPQLDLFVFFGLYSSFLFFLSGMVVFCAYVAPFFIAFYKLFIYFFLYYVFCTLLYFFFTTCVFELLAYFFVETLTEVYQPPKGGEDVYQPPKGGEDVSQPPKGGDDHPPRPWHQIDCSKFQGSLTKYNKDTDIIVHNLKPVLLECDSDSTTSGNARTLTFTNDTPKYGPLTFTLTIPEDLTRERTLTVTDNRTNTATIMLPNNSNSNSTNTATIMLPNTSTSSNPMTFRNQVDMTITFTNNGNRTTTVTLCIPGSESVTNTYRDLKSRHIRTFLHDFYKVYEIKPVDNKE